MVKTSVYIADISCLKEPHVFETLYRAVSAERQEKIDRLLFPEDKQRSLGAACLLKRVLSELNVSSFALSYGENGKPFLQSHPEIFFNLSHSGERVICAVSGRKVGCDIEKIRARNRNVAGRFFSPSETERMKQEKSDAGQTSLFFRLWTLKESFVKATGRGMTPGFGDISLELTPEGADPLACGGEVYRFKSYPAEDYQISLCGTAEDLCEATLIALDLAR